MLRAGKRFTATVGGADLNGHGRLGARVLTTDPAPAGRTRPRTRAAALAGTVAALVLIAAGCGDGSSTATTTRPAASTTPVGTTTTTTTTPAAESGLSGQWKGQYSGAYSGTFVLHWQQSGSSLGGKITISSPLSTLDVNGTLHGSAITFGTVGSLAITYTGTVSGSSMSGSYSTPGGGGSWSAGKS